MNKSLLYSLLSVCGLGIAIFLGFSSSDTHAATLDISPGVVSIDGTDNKCSLAEALANVAARAQTHQNCPAGDGNDIINIPSGNYDTTTLTNLTTLQPSTTLAIKGDVSNRPVFNSVNPLTILVASNISLSVDSINFLGSSANETGGLDIRNFGKSMLQNTKIKISNTSIVGGVANYMFYFMGDTSSDFTIQNMTISDARGSLSIKLDRGIKGFVENFQATNIPQTQGALLAEIVANSTLDINNILLDHVNGIGVMIPQVGTTADYASQISLKNFTIHNSLIGIVKTSRLALTATNGYIANTSVGIRLDECSPIINVQSIYLDNVVIENTHNTRSNPQNQPPQVAIDACGHLEVKNSYIVNHGTSQEGQIMLRGIADETKPYIFENTTIAGSGGIVLGFMPGTKPTKLYLNNNTFSLNGPSIAESVLPPPPPGSTAPALPKNTLYARNNIFSSSTQLSPPLWTRTDFIEDTNNYGTYQATPSTHVVQDLQLASQAEINGSTQPVVGYITTSRVLTFAVAGTSVLYNAALTNCPNADSRLVNRPSQACTVGAYQAVLDFVATPTPANIITSSASSLVAAVLVKTGIDSTAVYYIVGGIVILVSVLYFVRRKKR